MAPIRMFLDALLLLPFFFFAGVLGEPELCFFPSGNHFVPALTCWNASTGFQTGLCCTAGDLCIDNSLCARRLGDGQLAYYRGGCLDATWKSSSCPHYCLDRPKEFVDVHQCGEDEAWTRWSCDDGAGGNGDFCGHGRHLFGLDSKR